MLRPRLIVSLLLKDGGLVKSENFSNFKYVGDPLNAVKIFSDKEVDELSIVDIDATVKGSQPNFNLIRNIAVQSRMPLSYGGGIKNLSHVEQLINLGVEKVTISSALFEKPNFIKAAVKKFGSQSLVAVLDVKKTGVFKSNFSTLTHNGSKKVRGTLKDHVNLIQNLGFGEIVLNSIDRDGMMDGYDHALVREVIDQVTVPLTCLGGASTIKDCQNLINEFGYIGTAAGSMFVFKGKYKAVLLQYPNRLEKPIIH
jgi:imidazole glycerol-phosphate synthase subunit HisF